MLLTLLCIFLVFYDVLCLVNNDDDKLRALLKNFPTRIIRLALNLTVSESVILTLTLTLRLILPLTLTLNLDRYFRLPGGERLQ